MLDYQGITLAHIAKKVVEWFKDNNINLIKHPAISCDTSPKESIWTKSIFIWNGVILHVIILEQQYIILK